MATPTPIVGPGTLLGEAVRITPSLAILFLLTCVVAALIYAYQPPIPQSMVFALLPWIVTGAFLNVLAANAEYPPSLVPLLTEPGAYLTVIFIPGLVWVAMLNVSVPRRGLPAYHHYLGTMGVGTMVILWVVLTLHLGTSNRIRMLVLVIVPMVALLATGLVSFSIAFWSPDFTEYAAVTGGFAVFGLLVNGIATTTTVAVNGSGAHTAFSRTVREIVVVGAPNGMLGVDVTHLWVWLFLLANMAIGIHVATQLAPYAKTSPRAVYTMQGIVGVVGFTLGFEHLLALVVG